EAAHLQTLGISGGMVITEAGQNAGFRFPGLEEFMTDVARFDALMQIHPVIIGCCLWTYGTYQNYPANIQSASQNLAGYLEANPIQPWQPPQPSPTPNPIPEVEGQTVITTRQVNLRTAPRLLIQTQFVLLDAGRVFEKIGEVEGDDFAGDATWVQVAAYLHKSFVAPVGGDGNRVVTTKQVNLRTAPRLSSQNVVALLNAERVFEQLGEVEGDVFAGEQMWVRVALYLHSSFVTGVGAGDSFRFTHWPTTVRAISQSFGNNPTYYNKKNLPGHEGLDLAAPLGSSVFSVADGTVSDIHPVDDKVNGKKHAYGIFVRIRHGDSGYETTYGHLQQALVQLNDEVRGGDLIGRADNTGDILSGDSHLHLTLKHDEAVPGGAKYIGYPFKIVDPTPFIAALLDGTPPAENEVDLLAYMSTNGNSPLYEVQTMNGGQQRHQTQVVDDKFFHTKDGEWEELWADNRHIFRGTDTSPGNGEYYTLRDGTVYGSKWAERRMAVGETFERNPVVINFGKNGCQELRRGSFRSWLKLVAVHPTYTFFTGVKLQDVIELAWLGSLTGEPLETYFYSKGIGLVGWKSRDGRQSAVSEIHEPGARPDNVREKLSCLVTD
ncbi:MAG: M23 family metallopeptidase, partial [Chloroflexi bacterium]|nr:M23 family metallopeptidase [Chloroflexota bacterium]